MLQLPSVTHRNSGPTLVAITPGLTFQQLLHNIARDNASAYEIVSTDGVLFAGEVAQAFTGQPEARSMVRKVQNPLL